MQATVCWSVSPASPPEGYSCLANKTRAFFRTVALMYPNVEWVIKIGGWLVAVPAVRLHFVLGPDSLSMSRACVLAMPWCCGCYVMLAWQAYAV